MTDFIVTNANDSGAGSLRQAVLDSNESSGADRIIFDDSLGGSTINLTSGEIEIADDLTVEGLGAENLTIDAGGDSRIFVIDKDGGLFDTADIEVSLEDLTITGGFSTSGGGAILALSNFGIGVDLTISDSVFSDNNTDANGGAIFANGDSQIAVSNSFFSNNIADGDGGAIDGDFTTDIDISGGNFSENTASGDGGAVSNDIGTITVSGSTIRENSSGNRGGGIYSGNGIGINDGTIIDANVAGGDGGGLHTESLLIRDSTITNNQAVEKGGGIRANQAIIIVNSNISNNKSDTSGGGISLANFFGSNKAIVANTTISGNQAKSDGGGIAVGGGVIEQNSITDENGEPTPIDTTRGELKLFREDLFLVNVTISGNLADSDNDGEGYGGGIYNVPLSRTPLSDSRDFVNIPAKITLEN